MTKKDFELIAHALYAARTMCGRDAEICGVRLAAAELANELANANPRFDRASFLAATRGE